MGGSESFATQPRTGQHAHRDASDEPTIITLRVCVLLSAKLSVMSKQSDMSHDDVIAFEAYWQTLMREKEAQMKESQLAFLRFVRLRTESIGKENGGFYTLNPGMRQRWQFRSSQVSSPVLDYDPFAPDHATTNVQPLEHRATDFSVLNHTETDQKM